MSRTLGYMNPVLERELRQRSRTRRSGFTILFFLLFLCLVSYLTYQATSINDFQFEEAGNQTSQVGRAMFEVVVGALVVVLLFIVPGVSSSAITGERDRQTLVPLQVTRLGPLSIFFGKVFASSAYVLLLLAAALPVLAVPYIVGGVSLGQVLLTLFVLFGIGFVLAVIGVACSCMRKRTQTATLMTYGLVLLMLLGTGIFTIAWAILEETSGDGSDPPLTALYLNPFIAVSGSAGDVRSTDDGPFSSIKQEFVRDSHDLGWNNFENGQAHTDMKYVPLWLRSLGSLGLLAAFFGFLGIRRLQTPQQVVH